MPMPTAEVSLYASANRYLARTPVSQPVGGLQLALSRLPSTCELMCDGFCSDMTNPRHRRQCQLDQQRCTIDCNIRDLPQSFQCTATCLSRGGDERGCELACSGFGRWTY